MRKSIKKIVTENNADRIKTKENLMASSGVELFVKYMAS